MYKLKCLLLGICFMFLFGCGSAEDADSFAKENAAPEKADNVEGTVDAGLSQDRGAASEIDVDLTTMSATIVYSQVSDMMTNPGNYEGKVIKMNGIYQLYTNEDGSVFYPACVIMDATACCANGIEFLPPEDANLTAGEEITVIGTFEKYYEDGYLYCHLVDTKVNP